MRRILAAWARSRRAVWIAGVAMTMAVFLAGAKQGKNNPEKQAETPVVSPLPADLNEASLRVAAIDVLYELDLTSEQLHVVRAAAAAAHRARAAAKGDAKLATALASLNAALLDGKDDQQIAKLRNQVTELLADDATHLDDEIQPTDKARASAPAIVRQLDAGQIAAYLASHADEVADPAERMVSALTEMAEEGNKGADPVIQEVSDEVGPLVAGADEARVTAIAAKVAQWLKSNRDVKEDEIAMRHAELEESAKKVLGDVSPMDVLSHWMENDMAGLLSNPQLPEAVDAILAAREQAH